MDQTTLNESITLNKIIDFLVTFITFSFIWMALEMTKSFTINIFVIVVLCWISEALRPSACRKRITLLNSHLAGA